MSVIRIRILFISFFLTCFSGIFAGTGDGHGPQKHYREQINTDLSTLLTNRTRLDRQTGDAISLANADMATYGLEDELTAASDKSVRDSIEALFRKIATNATWIDNITDNMSIAYPFGMHKVIGGTTYEIGFANIGFNKTGAVARVFARAILPQKSSLGNAKTLYFAGLVSMARGGGIISDGKLYLVGDDVVPGGDQWTLSLNGMSSGGTGSAGAATYFRLDCSGFIELGINGKVILDKKFVPVDPRTFKPVGNNTAITAPIIVSIAKWDDLYAESLKFSGTFSFQPVPGYAFGITTATLDFTDAKNPAGDAIKNYIQGVQSVLPNTWRGLNITGIDVYLPKYFNAPNAANAAKVNGTFAAIDDNGFSVKVSGNNILDIKAGSANGWPISVDKFNIDIQKNAIAAGSFSGKLVLPVEDKKSDKSGIDYSATINSDGGFDVTHGEVGSIKADLWKSYLSVDPGFELSLVVKDNNLLPKVSLSGKFSFFFNGSNKLESVITKAIAKTSKVNFAIEDASFEEMVLQTEKPFMTVKSLGTSSQLEIGGFSADVSVEYKTKRPVVNDANAEYSCLHFDANVQLMEGKIGGGTAFDIYSRYDTAKREWTYDSYQLTQIKINAEFGKVSFKGSLDIMNDSIYGKGFNGIVQLKVATIDIKAGAMFGTKSNSDGSSFKYWNVDAYVKGLNITLFNIITIQGFSGGATYRMDPVPPDAEHPITASGVSYVPNENSFLRLRAGIFLSLVNKTVISGWGGLEIVFNKSWGVDEFSISGNAQFFSKGVDENSSKSKISPLTKGNKQTKASRLTDAAAKAPPAKTPKAAKPVQTVKVAPKVSSKPIVDKSGKAITTKKGKPLVSKTTEKTMATVVKDKSGKALLDKNGKFLEVTTATKTTSRVAMGKSGKPLLDASGDPILINATVKTVKTPVVDAQGKPVLDEKGNATYETKKELVTPKVLVDATGKPVLDKKGNPIIKYKVKNITKKKGKEKEEEGEEEEEGGDDKVELADSKEDATEEADAADNTADAGDNIADNASQYLMTTDNPDLTAVSQELLVAKNELNKALAEMKTAQANQHGPDSAVAVLKEMIENTLSSGSDNGFINVPVREHNWFRNGPDWDVNAWPKVCSILHLPFIPDNLIVKEGTYSMPTQAEINKAKDSVNTSADNASKVAQPAYREWYMLANQSQLYKDCRACAENWYSNKTRCGISTDIKDTAKNRLVIKNWKRQKDSLDAVLKVLDAKRTKLSDSASAIYDVYRVLKNNNLLDNARRELNYYNLVYGRKKMLEDSVSRYYTNVAAPLDAIADTKTAAYNEQLNAYNPVLAKFNNLVTIGEAGRVGELAKGARVKLLNGITLTAAETALLNSSDSLNALAASLQKNLNNQALAESSKKLSQDTSTRSAMAKAVSEANNKLAALKQSSPNSQEYQNAVLAQKNAQSNLDAFVTQLGQDSAQFRQDSALISDNILADKGGAVITVTPAQLSYINRKYAQPTISFPAGSPAPQALFIVNNPDAASVKIYTHKSAAQPRFVTVYDPIYINGRYSYWAQPSQEQRDAVNADQDALSKAKEWLDEADNAMLDSLDKASAGSTQQKSTAVMPVGARPDGEPPFWGNFLAKVDLANEALSFNMDVYAALGAGNTVLFEGAGANSLAGSGEVYYSKGAWHIYLGTKETPMAMKLNMGPISGSATTYFQASNALQSDGSDIVVKHGLKVDVQFDWSASFAYATIKGGVGYDILIKHKEGFICSSTNQPAGIYGWYGKGNLTAYLSAEAGVRFSIPVYGNVSFSVLSGSITANLEVRAPNPVYFKGSLNVKYSVGCCGVSWSGDFNVSMEKGTYCSFD